MVHKNRLALWLRDALKLWAMKERIRTAEDLSLFLSHTRRFQGGKVTDLHVQRRCLFDEGSGREVRAGTVLTAIIRYEVPSVETQGLHAIVRVAKLTMLGVSDFSIFEQEGSDCSEIGVIHAEIAWGRLRFWFDPQGELYVVCDEAEFEEVSMPGPGRPVPSGITDWTFQARTGDVPGIAWFLDHLDRAGFPCAWRAAKRPTPCHPAWRWQGELMSASQQGDAEPGLVHVQTYGPLDGSGFGVTLRACHPSGAEAARLVLVLADIIARHFEGTCLAGRHILERDEWCGAQCQGPPMWWAVSDGRGQRLSQGR